jgi:hypothetical protein
MRFAFPIEFYLATTALEILRARGDNLFSLLPRDILRLIFNRMIDPISWPNQNLISIDDVKVVLRPVRNMRCAICDGVLAISRFDSGLCTRESCRHYSHKCRHCHVCVPHGSPSEVSCTRIRCIGQKCKLCSGELKYSADDSRKLCTIYGECTTYRGSCTCGGLIRKTALNVLTECTEYRCVHHRCNECGLMIRSSAVTNDGCFKGHCLSVDSTMATGIAELSRLVIPDTSPAEYWASRTNKQILVSLKLHFVQHILSYNNDAIIRIQALFSVLG